MKTLTATLIFGGIIGSIAAFALNTPPLAAPFMLACCVGLSVVRAKESFRIPG